MSARRPAKALLAAALLILPLAGCVVQPTVPVVVPYPYGYSYPAYGYAAPAPVGPNTATGVATGAVAGGLLGAAVSDPYNRGAGAATGAAAGALIGGLVGNAADQRDAEAAQGYGTVYDGSTSYGTGGYGGGYSPYPYAATQPPGYGY
jgi:hypothetical protein